MYYTAKYNNCKVICKVICKGQEEKLLFKTVKISIGTAFYLLAWVIKIHDPEVYLFSRLTNNAKLLH